LLGGKPFAQSTITMRIPEAISPHKITLITKMIEQNKQKQKTVFVGLSGGVDSSVSAYLLKEKGYKVVGAFIKVWQPDVVCDWKEDRRSAMRVAARLDIPFVTIDLSKEYKEEVVDYMLREYREGRTPNPDVMCNKEIKFKAFLNKALGMGADMIATGHYARVSTREFPISNFQFPDKELSLPPKIYQLQTALDAAKEQSYFLWTLNQNELSKTLFPIGGLMKSEVRKIAEKARLHTFEKKDSQGLCFIGKVDFKEFLKSKIDQKPGDVLDTNGRVIGHHDGAYFFTIGERHGFIITDKGTNDAPLYVVSKDVLNNTITVSPKSNYTFSDSQKCNILIEETNWVSEEPIIGKVYDAQVRYHQAYQKCKVEVGSDSTAKVEFLEPQVVASGQSIVIYDQDTCLGGGVVK